MKMEPIHSRLSIHGHPIHPMLIHFPVAALLMLLAADLGYWLTQDFFWARAGLWLAGVGVVCGWLSSLAGLVDVLAVPRIRHLITAWCHALLGVTMLSLASANLLLRLEAPAAHILPWGLYLSLMTALLIALASSFGGKLVYDHALGVDLEAAHSKSAKIRTIRG